MLVLLVGCSHHYHYARGSFYCSKCGKKSNSRTYRARRYDGRRTGVIITVLVVALLTGMLYWTGLLDNTTALVQDEISNHVTLTDSQITVNLPDIDSIGDELSTQVESITEGLPVRTASEFDSDVIEDHIYLLTNNERQDMGISTLVRIQDIDRIARNHSMDMSERGYFEHETPEGLDPTDRGNRVGYSCLKEYDSYYTEGLAENISQSHTYSSYMTAGVTSSYVWYDDEETVAKNIVTGWMNSPGHRENILEGAYDRIGIGVAINPDETVYATQNFC